MGVIYFKDGFLPAEHCSISLYDRALRFGDGLFETVLVCNHTSYNLFAHVDRLLKGLKLLHIAIDTTSLPFLCGEVIKRNQLEQGYIRIFVSRGESAKEAMGYLPENTSPYFLIETLDKPYPDFKAITLWTASLKAGFTLKIKSANALGYSLAMMEAREQDCDNALLVDNAGNICETASGNLFYIQGETLYMPAADLPLIQGTVAAAITALWEGELRQCRFTLEDLRGAQEVFMTNIGVLVAPITALRPLGLHFPVGDKTRHLRKSLDEAIRKATQE